MAAASRRLWVIYYAVMTKLSIIQSVFTKQVQVQNKIEKFYSMNLLHSLFLIMALDFYAVIQIIVKSVRLLS